MCARAAGEQVPEPLLAQLSPGGRLVIPVGREHGSQALMVIDKRADGSVAPPRREMGVVYIPLTSRQHQMSRAAGK